MKLIKAVAGVLYQDGVNGNRKVLMASRPADKIFPGYWEFPGGKIEDAETANEAIIRELEEEIGVIVSPDDLEYFTYIEQVYSHGKVCLDVVLVKKWNANIQAIEHQALHWQEIGQRCDLSPLLITTQQILDLLQNIN